MTPSQPCLELIDRLRGIYRLHVNDGAGLLNGSDVHESRFQTSPIQHEAATEIELLSEALAAAEAEVQRLREALSSIAAYRIHPDRTEGRLGPAYTASKARQVAHAALEQAP